MELSRIWNLIEEQGQIEIGSLENCKLRWALDGRVELESEAGCFSTGEMEGLL